VGAPATRIDGIRKRMGVERQRLGVSRRAIRTPWCFGRLYCWQRMHLTTRLAMRQMSGCSKQDTRDRSQAGYTQGLLAFLGPLGRLNPEPLTKASRKRQRQACVSGCGVDSPKGSPWFSALMKWVDSSSSSSPRSEPTSSVVGASHGSTASTCGP
jgi:hypothetical protein